MNRHLRRAEALTPWLLGVVVLVLGVAVWVVQAEADERPHAEVGAVFQRDDYVAPLKHRGEALLPWAKVELAAEPQDSLPDINGGDANVREPKGGSFVHVQVAVSAADFLVSTTMPHVSEPALVLRADDRDYPLTGSNGVDLGPDNRPTTGQEDRWVAVDGHPDHLELVLRLDGEEQVVQAADGSVDLGRAEELRQAMVDDEAAGDPEPFSCGAFTRLDDSDLRTGARRFINCRVTAVTRTPYADGLGWARPGHEFLVVQLEPPEFVSIYLPDQPQQAITLARYASKLDFSARLGDQPSIDLPPSIPEVGSVPNTFAFEVPHGKPVDDLAFTTHVDARPNNGFDVRHDELELRWTIPGRKLS